MIKFLDLSRQYQKIKPKINKAIQRVLSSQEFILGKEVRKLEERLANWLGVKEAIGVANGTEALSLALKALGVREGDKVITSPFTFFATAEAIINTGAEPLFIDVDPATFNLSPAKLEAYLYSLPKKALSQIKVIIPVHLFGQVAEMDLIIKIVSRAQIKVLEDGAQSIGGEYKNIKSGVWGDLGCFSFYPTKTLGGYGDGGLIVTNKKRLSEQIRKLRSHGQIHQYHHAFCGYNSRLDEIQAAILNVKFLFLEQWLKKRKAIASLYTELLSGIEEITPPYILPQGKHSFHVYTIKVKRNLRGKLKEYLAKAGIQTRVYYPLPLHLQKALSYLGYQKGDFPVAEELSKVVLSLSLIHI